MQKNTIVTIGTEQIIANFLENKLSKRQREGLTKIKIIYITPRLL